MRRVVSALLCTALLCSCVALESVPRIDEEQNLTYSDGITYYLPRSLLELTVTPYKIGNSVARYELTSTDKIIPDINNRLTLHYAPSALANDRVCAATKDGLLLSVQVASDDQTPEILVSIARLAGRLFVNPFATQKGAAEGTGATADANAKFTMTIDPLDRHQWAAFNAAASRHFRNARFALNIPDIEQLAEEPAAECGISDICYRTAITVPIELQTPKGPAVTYAKVVSRRDLGRVSTRRAFLVEKISKFEFDDGVLKAMAIKKPSEALAFASLPLTLVDAVLTSALAAPSDALGRAFGGLTSDERKILLNELQASSEAATKAQGSLDRLRGAGIDQFSDAQIQFTCNAAGGTSAANK